MDVIFCVIFDRILGLLNFFFVIVGIRGCFCGVFLGALLFVFFLVFGFGDIFCCFFLVVYVNL